MEEARAVAVVKVEEKEVEAKEVETAEVARAVEREGGGGEEVVATVAVTEEETAVGKGVVMAEEAMEVGAKAAEERGRWRRRRW